MDWSKEKIRERKGTIRGREERVDVGEEKRRRDKRR